MRITCDQPYHEAGEGYCVHCHRLKVQAVEKERDAALLQVRDLREIIDILAVDSCECEKCDVCKALEKYKGMGTEKQNHACVKNSVGQCMVCGRDMENQKPETCGIMQYQPPMPCGLPLPCAVHDRNLDVDKRKCRCGADLTSQGHACAYFPSPTEKRNDETK